MIIILVLTSRAQGSAEKPTLSVGTVAERQPGLSLQYKHQKDRALHGTFHFLDSQAIRMSFDLQFLHRAFEPLWFYSGIGMSGQSRDGDDASESYFLNLPIGVQWNLSELPLELFSELVPTVGALPNTELAARLRVGIRAAF